MRSKPRRVDGRSKPRPGVDAQRRHILETAIQLFGAHGSREISVAKLCEAAEVSRPTFYRCFADKDELVATLYRESVMGPIQTLVLDTLKEGSGTSDWLPRAIDQMLDAIFDESEVAAMLFTESHDPTSPAFGIIEQARRVTSEVMAGAMERAGLRPVHPVTTKAMLVACQWIAHDAIRQGLTPEARRGAKEATKEIATRLFLETRA